MNLSPQQQATRDAMDWILANPQHWDQSAWHCGTSHCFAGVVQMLHHQQNPAEEFSGDPETASFDARSVMGISRSLAKQWFASANSLHFLQQLTGYFCDPLPSMLPDKSLWREAIGSRPDLTHELMVALASDDHYAVRRAIGSRPDLTHELMVALGIKS